MLEPIRLQTVKSSVAVRVPQSAATTLLPIIRERAIPAPRWHVGFGNYALPPVALENHVSALVSLHVGSQAHPEEIDPLYLFGCHAEWERRTDTSSAWELISAAESSHEGTRANARALLASSRHLEGGSPALAGSQLFRPRRYRTVEENMKTPYGLEIIENCTECFCRKAGFFCGFSPGVVESLDHASHHSTMPAGAILFVEGRFRGGSSSFVPAE